MITTRRGRVNPLSIFELTLYSLNLLTALVAELRAGRYFSLAIRTRRRAHFRAAFRTELCGRIIFTTTVRTRNARTAARCRGCATSGAFSRLSHRV